LTGGEGCLMRNARTQQVSPLAAFNTNIHNPVPSRPFSTHSNRALRQQHLTCPSSFACPHSAFDVSRAAVTGSPTIQGPITGCSRRSSSLVFHTRSSSHHRPPLRSFSRLQISPVALPGRSTICAPCGCKSSGLAHFGQLTRTGSVRRLPNGSALRNLLPLRLTIGSFWSVLSRCTSCAPTKATQGPKKHEREDYISLQDLITVSLFTDTLSQYLYIHRHEQVGIMA
jgi:hypothetical protein